MKIVEATVENGCLGKVISHEQKDKRVKEYGRFLLLVEPFLGGYFGIRLLHNQGTYLVFFSLFP